MCYLFKQKKKSLKVGRFVRGLKLRDILFIFPCEQRQFNTDTKSVKIQIKHSNNRDPNP